MDSGLLENLYDRHLEILDSDFHVNLFVLGDDFIKLRYKGERTILTTVDGMLRYTVANVTKDFQHCEQDSLERTKSHQSAPPNFQLWSRHGKFRPGVVCARANCTLSL